MEMELDAWGCVVKAAPREWPDWYEIRPEFAMRLDGIPGLKWVAGRWIAHATHLPLLGETRQAVDACAWLAASARRDTFDAYSSRVGGWTLRAYQHEGVEFIHKHHGALLAFEPRLGKTAVAVASHDPKAGPMVVVAPLNTRSVWRRWFHLRWPDIDPLFLTGRAYSRELVADTKLAFIHYDVLGSWQSFGNRRIGTLVFDEGHLLSNRKSLRSQAAGMLSTQAEKVICATGTPLWNEPMGLYTMLNCLNPGAWGSWFDFGTRYAAGYRGAHGFVTDGISNVEEFKSRLQEVMLLKTWRDVRAELPQTERRIRYVKVDRKDELRIDLAAQQARKATSSTVVGALAGLRRCVGVIKLDAACDEAEEALRAGERVVIWAWHRSVASALATMLEGRYPVWVVTGTEAIGDRERAMDEWRAASTGALVCTMAVAQAGIDLSDARVAIFAELDWTPATMAQAEMRTFSPEHAMRVVYCAIDHRVDHAICLALREKTDTADLIGVPAAEASLDTLRDAFGVDDRADLARLRAAITGGID